MRLAHRFPALALMLFAWGFGIAMAYDAQLTPDQIHDAYILGQRNDQATANFLTPYLKQPSGVEAPADSTRIAEIQVLTPFAQVVDRSRRLTNGRYTEEQAIREYRQRGNTIVISILLLRPGVFPKPEDNNFPSWESEPPAQASDLKPENLWQNFRFETKQNGKTIATRAIRNHPIYSTATKDTPAVLDGATVWLEYDAKDIMSQEILVQILTPEARSISASFDLAKLR